MPCHDCAKPAALARCETHNPKHAHICKDCCIKRAGQGCAWFKLCW